MCRSEDIDLEGATVSINRGLVAVGYQVHETRGKTSTSRRLIDLAPTTVHILSKWREWQHTTEGVAGVTSTGWVFTGDDGQPIHPHAFSQAFERIFARADVPRIRLHDVRHTHGTLLIKTGVPVKVVSERLGNANPMFTIDTYQHVLPACKPKSPGSSRTSSPQQPDTSLRLGLLPILLRVSLVKTGRRETVGYQRL